MLLYTAALKPSTTIGTLSLLKINRGPVEAFDVAGKLTIRSLKVDQLVIVSHVAHDSGLAGWLSSRAASR